MSVETPPTTTIWRKLARIFIRVMLAIALGFAIGIGIYLGIRTLVRQSNALVEQTELIQALDARLDLFETTVAAQADDLKERLDTAEQTAGDRQVQIVSSDRRLATIEAAQKTQAVEISSLENQISTLATDVGDMQADLVSPDELQSLDEQVDALTADLEAALGGQGDLSNTLETIQQSALAGEQSNQALLIQIEMLKAMQLLLRSNSFVEQGNYSQAAVDIQAASTLLVDLQDRLSPVGSEFLAAIVAVLDEAQDDLPSSPALAANRLEAAWQLLLLGLPAGALPTPTPAPTPTP